MTTPSDPHPSLLDLYKLAVEMADRVSARRGLSNSFFLTVQTSFVAATGITGNSIAKSLWTSLVFGLAGITLTAAWWVQLRSYRQLNNAKFAVINAIEKQLPAQIFTDEWAVLQKAAKGPRRSRYAELGFSERMVPLIFLMLNLLLLGARLMEKYLP
ncbi:RipA family octameric membrane protein [Actinomadura sp. 3N407]|uniref:RipA family octameric membrane protein n=1 Tax=Actinomadura sp. 3N407 TaxID=3457423 RepID=UPI003FCDAE37